MQRLHLLVTHGIGVFDGVWFYTSNRVLMVVWRDGSSDPVVNNLVKNEKFRCVLFVSTFLRVLSRCITLSNVIAYAGVVY